MGETSQSIFQARPIWDPPLHGVLLAMGPPHGLGDLIKIAIPAQFQRRVYRFGYDRKWILTIMPFSWTHIAFTYQILAKSDNI